MKLSKTQKVKLLNAATQVYKAYVALDFFKNRRFQVGPEQLTLKQICENAIHHAQFEQTIICGGQVFQLELIEDTPHSYKISFKRPVSASADSLRKPINDYDDGDALTLLTQQHFYMAIDDKAKYHVMNKLNDNTIIGGIGKLDLYRSHLVTLNNIIEKISSENDISGLLVALATGSGKTYVQALWILVLSLSGNNGLFAVPDKLVTQLRNDLRRVLPDNLVDALLVLRENEENPAVEAILSDLKTPAYLHHIIIGSSERLLDKHYQQLLEASSEHSFLSFDEQHLLMKSERRRVRLIELSKKMLTMFLTATPNQETYQLSGNKPVAIMSSGQKQAAGQGQFPELFSQNARNISDRNQLRDYRFWTYKFWLSLFRGILLRFSNAIQQEHSSAALSIVENLPFYFYRKPNEEKARWSMQVPMARKILCIIDDNETLVNFCHALEDRDENRRNVYHNGNLIDRQAIAHFFQLPNVDDHLVREDLTHKQEDHIKKLHLTEYAIGKRLVYKTLKKQIKDTIFHNMLEFVLMDLSGLDEIEHNQLRKMDLDGFQALIREKFVVRSTEYYQQKLERVIDASGAQQIAAILNHISVQLGQMHSATSEGSYSTYSFDDFNHCVDNWALDDHIIIKMSEVNYRLWQCFEEYANEHLMISVMSGMQSSETPVDESRPFSGLKETRYRMYHNGFLCDKAKRRQRTSLETLDDTSMESTFIPKYKDFNEEICDNYFRLGFVGVYVSNKKTEGFSDRNLHTVINLAEKKLSATNSPDTLIQGIGRNRGLDDTIVPAYIHALGRRQETSFNLEHLKSDDYYPELFKSQKSFHQQFIKILGESVGKEILHWFKNNVDKDETIDHDKFKKQVLKIIAKALRQLNNNNSHNIQLSRSQLTTVIGNAMKILGQNIAHIKKPYKLTLSTKALASLLNFICEIYYSVKRIKPALQRLKHAWFGVRTALDTSAVSRKHPDDVYIKIINKTDFKTLIANASVAKEFKDWMSRKNIGINTIIHKKTESFLKDKDKAQWIKDNLKPFAEKLALEELTPVLFHPKFYTVLNSLVGFLNDDDLTVMLQAMGKPEPKKQAAMVIRLLKIIKAHDKKALLEKFIVPEIEGETSIDGPPIKKTMETVGDVIQEIIDCQSYYNQHDNKGNQSSSTRPKLYNELSPKLQDIRVDSNHSFFSHFSRKIFFIQAIRTGLPQCAHVNGDSYQSQVKCLKRVQAHILRPLWWGTNISKLGYTLVKMGRNVTFSLKSCGFTLLNALKKILNRLSRQYFTLSTRNPMSQDYNDTAFDIAKKINELNPFDASRVIAKDCLIDTVTEIEDSIAARRSPQFFSPKTTQPIPTKTADELQLHRY